MRTARLTHERVSRQPGAGERRARPRGTPEGGPERDQLVMMIVGTYREMPGLTLYLGQAARLFNVRLATCQVVFDDLVRTRRLRRTADGQFAVV